MTNRITHRLAAVIMAAVTTTTMTAQGKLFTLEDLNFGGSNYRNMTVQTKYYAWWGDMLVSTERESCSAIDPKSKDKQPQTLFTLDDVNAHLDDEAKIRRLDYASFPYPDSTLAMVENGQWRVLYDWKKKKVSWKQKGNFDTNDWCAASRATAYVEDHQLFVRDAKGNELQLSTDGSREIVYGQSVHRDEFGIYKGTFWSPDGQRLAFYRMDQSMVTDYPQVNTSTRIATEEPDKYPMAGETSHLVTVGVYDLNIRKTVYLQAGDPTDRYFTNIQWRPDSKKI